MRVALYLQGDQNNCFELKKKNYIKPNFIIKKSKHGNIEKYNCILK